MATKSNCVKKVVKPEQGWDSEDRRHDGEGVPGLLPPAKMPGPQHF